MFTSIKTMILIKQISTQLLCSLFLKYTIDLTKLF